MHHPYGLFSKRRWAPVSRWIHIYLSMASFGILFFFAVTGLTLNHTEWFGDVQKATQQKGALNTAWMKTPEKLEIVEFLRTKHGVHGALSDFRIDDAQLAVSFKGPGYTADAFIERNSGTYELTETRMGFVAIINDLHKGRDSGKVWGWIIDLSAALMVVVSISGMVLILFLQKRLVTGLVTALIGCVLCYMVYVLWVP